MFQSLLLTRSSFFWFPIFEPAHLMTNFPSTVGEQDTQLSFLILKFNSRDYKLLSFSAL